MDNIFIGIFLIIIGIAGIIGALAFHSHWKMMIKINQMTIDHLSNPPWRRTGGLTEAMKNEKIK